MNVEIQSGNYEDFVGFLGLTRRFCAGINPDLDYQVFFPYNWAHIVLGKINRSLRLNRYEREAHSAST